MRAWCVRLGRVRCTCRKSELIDLDERRSARRRERPALELAVERTQHPRVTAAQDANSRLRLSEQIGKRNTETHRDLPEETDRRVRLAGLDLRERGATDAR